MLYEVITKLPKQYHKGIVFSTKTILRVGIVLYGFRLTFQSIEAIGIKGVLVSFLIVFLTFILGYIVGIKVFKLVITSYSIHYTKLYEEIQKPESIEQDWESIRGSYAGSNSGK